MKTIPIGVDAGTLVFGVIVTRADVWLRHREAWASGKYDSDYDFIAAVFANEKYIQERLVELGWDVIRDLLPSRREEIEAEGWVIYDNTRRMEKFSENLDAIVKLVGSARYETMCVDMAWYVRRVED